MNNYKLEYWIESVESIMEEMNYDIPIEDITTMAESMIITAEQESLAFGYDAIPNPLQTEIDKLRNDMDHEQVYWERRELIYLRSIAKRNNVHVDDVFIANDNVWYQRRGL